MKAALFDIRGEEENTKEKMSSRGGTLTAGKGAKPQKQREDDASREEQLRVLVEEATAADSGVEPRVLKVIKDAYALETLANKDKGRVEEVSEFLEASEDQLRKNVSNLVRNKDAFAQRLVAIFNAGQSLADTGKQGKRREKGEVREREPSPEKEPEDESRKRTKNIYTQFIRDLNDIGERALVPLLSFAGMVAVKLGKTDARALFVYRKDKASETERLKVFDETADTREAFLATVKDAGPTLTTMVLTTLEKEAQDLVQAMDQEDADNDRAALLERRGGSRNSMLGACFDLDELDRGINSIPHAAFSRQQLDRGLLRDEATIRALREELATLKEALEVERRVDPSTELKEKRDEIEAKRGEIAEQTRRGRPRNEVYIRQLEQELMDLVEQEDALMEEPRARLFDIQERIRERQDDILRRQQTTQSRLILQETREAIKEIGLSDVERRFAPAWAFEVMGSAIYRRVLSTTTLAAFEAAQAHVNRIPGCETFTMKELICSTAVADMFAFLVASNFLSAGDGTSELYANRNNRGNSRVGRGQNYLNVTRMRDILAEKVVACKVWFESVVRRPNKLVGEFAAKLQSMHRQKVHDAGDDEAALDRVQQWKDRMTAYQKMLPQYELVYVG